MLQAVTVGYNRLQGLQGVAKGLKSVTRGHRRLYGV